MSVLCALVVACLVIDASVIRHRLEVPAGALRSKTELVLRNIRFDKHPGTQFHVLLERRDDPTKRARAGTLSFYAKTAAQRTFDVTDELRKIAGSKADLDEVNVVFEATLGRANSEVAFDPDTKLTIGEITLRLKK